MAKIAGKGTLFQIAVGASYSTVAQLRDISCSGAEAIVYDSTTLDTGGGRTSAVTGYSNPGTVTISGLYDPSDDTHNLLTAKITSPVDSTYKIVFSDETEQTFTAAGLSFDVSASLDDATTFTATFQLSSLATFPT